MQISVSWVIIFKVQSHIILYGKRLTVLFSSDNIKLRIWIVHRQTLIHGIISLLTANISWNDIVYQKTHLWSSDNLSVTSQNVIKSLQPFYNGVYFWNLLTANNRASFSVYRGPQQQVMIRTLLEDSNYSLPPTSCLPVDSITS